MKKRFICATLAAVMLLSVFAIGPFQARAESNLTISEMGEAMIKAFEGINWQPKWDNKQASVGYGCSVTDERWAITDPTDPLYVDKQKDENGNFIMQYNSYKGGNDYVISLEGAQMLLNEHMAKHAAAVNDFANRHGLTFTQGQFDALVSLSFNIGSSFLTEKKKDWHIHKALASGDKGAYLAYAFALYSTSGGVTTQGHLKRRLLELDMFLYDKYDTSKGWPEDVRYILFDGNGGTTEYNPHGFNIHYPVTDMWVTFTSTPTGKDAAGNPFTYEFAGWYTKPVGGEQITVLDASLENGMILYAHWKNPTTGQIDDLQPGTAVDVKVKTTSSVTMREGPCTYYTSVRTVYSGELLHITRVTTGKDGKQWGLTPEGWVRLDYTNYGTTGGSGSSGGTVNTGVLKNPISGTVTGDNVNIRTGPGTNYGKTGTQYDKGTSVTILEIQNGADSQPSRQWGKLSDGSWICMDYVALSGTPEFVGGEQTPADPTVPDVSGAITVTSVEIKALPTKTEYVLNGSERVPDLTGGRIKVTLSSGSSKWIDMTRGMVTGFDNSKLGTNTITVSVGGKSDTFTVQIVPNSVESVEVVSLPYKSIYLQGVDQLDLTGCKLKVTYTQGGTSEIDVTADMVTGFDNTTVGTKTLTVTYEGHVATFRVEVIGDEVKSISMHTLPDKTEYLVGVDALDLTGASITVNYNYSGAKTVALTAGMVTGFDNTVAGVKLLTVTYEGCTTTFHVEVVDNQAEGISIETMPAKTKYLLGKETLDLTGATIRVRYDHTGEEVVTLTADMVTGFDNSVAGIQTLTVTYEGFTTTLDIEIVEDRLMGISMQTLPAKLQYQQGLESLDLTGAMITAQYSYTGAHTIPVTADMVTGFDHSTGGIKTLTVTYNGQTTSFTVEILLHTVVFVGYDGTVLQSAQYALGDTVTPPQDPSKPADSYGEYGFAGWDKQVVACNGSTTYTAVFTLLYPKGDVNRDMQVNEDDAIYLLRHVVFPEKYPVAVTCDFDKDGKVDEDDAIYLLRHVVFPEKYPLT